VASVSAAYQAFITDVQHYQTSADDAHASSAASLFAACVDVSVKLAVHQEQHNAETLAELTQAVQLACEWSHSLVGV
jgi:hypothetical protein